MSEGSGVEGEYQFNQVSIDNLFFRLSAFGVVTGRGMRPWLG